MFLLVFFLSFMSHGVLRERRLDLTTPVGPRFKPTDVQYRGVYFATTISHATTDTTYLARGRLTDRARCTTPCCLRGTRLVVVRGLGGVVTPTSTALQLTGLANRLFIFLTSRFFPVIQHRGPSVQSPCPFKLGSRTPIFHC